MKHGIGFTGALAILFIALKLMGHIAWSWLWVLSPLWIPWGIALVIVLAIIGVVLVVKLIEGVEKIPSK